MEGVEAPEFVTLTIDGMHLENALAGEGGRRLQNDVLPEFLARQRWFAGKGEAIRVSGIDSLGSLPGEANQLTVIELGSATGDKPRYLLPLTVLWGDENVGPGAPKLKHTLAVVRDDLKAGALLDASFDERFVRALLTAMQAGAELPGRDGSVRFAVTRAFQAMDISGDIRALGAEQSNVSLLVGGKAIVKLYRRLRSGEQPEIEVARFLTEVAGFANTPAFLGSAEHVSAGGVSTAFAAAFAFVPNQGDTWSVVLDSLERGLESTATGGNAPPSAADLSRSFQLAETLGRRTAEMHVALASPTDDPAFAAQPIAESDLANWVDAARDEAIHGLALVERASSEAGEGDRDDLNRLLGARQAVLDRLQAIRSLTPSGLKTRIHGDYHLGQVLAADDDAVILDFEGEPQRDVEERRQKSSPLRDVAGMLRSFDYAAWSALDRLRSRNGTVDEHTARRAFAWRASATEKFLNSYWSNITRPGLLPEEASTRQSLLELFLLQKAFYEVSYEAANRPGWLSIPVRGLLDLLYPPKASS